MILRLPSASASESEEFIPAWEAVERTQTQSYESCWMVTQPSHAALAGELAAKLAAPQFPTPDGEILQAISLHDAGWGILDAEAIKRSTSTQQQRPRSFL